MKVVSSERRRRIFQEFEGSVVGMVKHREAGKVLADAFEVYAGEWERAVLVKGFFGKEVMLFGGVGFKDGSEEEKAKAKRGLKGILEGMDVEKRKRILASMKENLMTMYASPVPFSFKCCIDIALFFFRFNNPDKGGVTHAIVHRALWEYLSAINDTTIIPSESEQEKLRREMFESCQEVLAEMVHTKDGSRIVRDFLAWGTAKVCFI
jgi:pumilio family protein 6